MCGMNQVVYISPAKVFRGIERHHRETKLARILILLIHESAHHIVRSLDNTFEATTPRGTPDWQQLEAGYRLEYCIFGDIFRYQYWQMPKNILDLSQWNVDSTIIFSADSEKMIKLFSRCIQNEQQSGIDADNGPSTDL